VTPYEAGFRQPAEWEPHEACWIAWPHLANEWLDDLEPARAEVRALCEAIADPDPKSGMRRGETVRVLVPDEAAERNAYHALVGLPVAFHRVPYGDIWLRDIAPIFVADGRGQVAATRFAFNGWGGKYFFDGDPGVAERIAEITELPSFEFDWVLEGGAVDSDGQGTCLTTRQCLLNPNRNPHMDAQAIERGLRDALGADKVLWLDEGLLNDHTDGHVDTVARFVAPGVVVCMEARDPDDPNAAVLSAIAASLSKMTDATGRALDVVRIPSPGRIVDAKGRVMPASYANFYIGNRVVAVPTYGSRWDAEAVERIGALFPDRRVAGLPSEAILTGGGAFHCITQQQPRAKEGVQEASEE
jgi:agmatine deiminase